MAVDRNTMGALQILDNILARSSGAREQDKQRAFKIAELKVRQDEQELNRLNDKLNRLESQNSQIESKFAGLVGAEAALERLESVTSSDAMSIIGIEKNNAANKLQRLQLQIQDAKNRRAASLGAIAEFEDAAKNLAPDFFNKFRDPGKQDKSILERNEIDAEEFAYMLDALKNEGINLTDIQKAGIQQSFQSLGASRFQRELAESEHNLRNLNLRLKMSQTSGSKKAVKDTQKMMIEQYRQTFDGLKGQAKRLEMDIKDMVNLPELPMSTSDVVAAQKELGREFFRYMKDNQGIIGNVYGKAEELYSAVEDSNNEQERQIAEQEFLRYFMGNTDKIESMLGSNWFSGEEEEALYMTRLVEMAQVLDSFNDLGFEGLGESDTQYVKSVMSEQEPAKASSSPNEKSFFEKGFEYIKDTRSNNGPSLYEKYISPHFGDKESRTNSLIDFGIGVKEDIEEGKEYLKEILQGLTNESKDNDR